jgi:tRNA (guanine37-N1)-methyltransferase
MLFDIITIFPGLFEPFLSSGVLGRAVERGVVRVRVHDLRDYTDDRHRTTDDRPYGGGAGMVMKVEPLARAIRGLKAEGPVPTVVLLTPQGGTFDQLAAERYARMERIVLICGRYEGVDERVRGRVDEELSVGDFILSGGEPAALVVLDAVARLKEGTLGSRESLSEESFSGGLLEYPQYTRPPEFEGLKVPEVLLSGDHEAVRRWRRSCALAKTFRRRPDLLAGASLSPEDRELLAEALSGEDE